MAMANNSPTLKEIAEQRARESVALAALGLSGKTADLTWDLRKLAVVVAEIERRHRERKR